MCLLVPCCELADQVELKRGRCRGGTAGRNFEGIDLHETNPKTFHALKMIGFRIKEKLKWSEGGFCALMDSRPNVRMDGRGIKVEYNVSVLLTVFNGRALGIFIQDISSIKSSFSRISKEKWDTMLTCTETKTAQFVAVELQRLTCSERQGSACWLQVRKKIRFPIKTFFQNILQMRKHLLLTPECHSLLCPGHAPSVRMTIGGSAVALDER